MLIKTLLAFFLRDAAIKLSYRLDISFNILTIFFSAATFFFVGKLFGPAASPALGRYGGDYFAFVLIGIAFSVYQGVGLNSFAQSLRQEQFLGTLEAILSSPVSIPRFLLGSALWDFFYASCEVALYLILGTLFFGLGLSHANLPAALLMLALTLSAFLSFGLLSAAFILRFKRGDPVAWFLAVASELLGGVYFPLDVLPGWLKNFSVFIPMTHALEGLRRALLSGAGISEVLPQIFALTLFTSIVFPLGLLLFRVCLKRAMEEGTLGHY